MDFVLQFNINKSIFIKNPEDSLVGKKIITYGVNLIYELGFESFTFKKLAEEIGTTEATVYRYFENKYMLLLYLINWYWYYLDFLFDYKMQNIDSVEEKLHITIQILSDENNYEQNKSNFDINKLNQIVIAESSKAYLVKNIKEINKNKVFNPYKELCKKISLLILTYNPNYPFAKSLSSTLIETSHYQKLFSKHLPKLSDCKPKQDYTSFVKEFLTHLLFTTIKKKP